MFLSLLSAVFSKLESTLFKVKPSKKKGGEVKKVLRSQFKSSTLSVEELQRVRSRLFVRPQGMPAGPVVLCGRTVVITMSARPKPEPSWDAAQFELLQSALRTVCQRSQYQQVVALVRTASKTVRKLSQVGAGAVVVAALSGLPRACQGHWPHLLQVATLRPSLASPASPHLFLHFLACIAGDSLQSFSVRCKRQATRRQPPR